MEKLIKQKLIERGFKEKTLLNNRGLIGACIEETKEQLRLYVVSSSYKPEPPKPPLSRMIRAGVGRFCKNCNSTMSRHGFLRLFGKRYCDNKKCPNSKLEKNYY